LCHGRILIQNPNELTKANIGICPPNHAHQQPI